MKRGIQHLLLTLAFVTGALALAAPAAAKTTKAEAQRIAAALAAYFGRPAAGQAKAVTVEPEAGHYRIRFALDSLLKPLDRLWISAAPATYTFTAAPLPDGTWRLGAGSGPDLAFDIGPSAILYRLQAPAGHVVFDPSIGFARSAEVRYDGSHYELAAPGGTSWQSTGPGSLTLTTAVRGADDVDLRYEESLRSGVISRPLRTSRTLPGERSDVAQHQGEHHFGETSSTVGLNGFRPKAVAALWVFLAQHDSAALLVRDGARLRALLRAAMPLFRGLQSSIGSVGSRYDSPVGSLTLARWSIGLDIPGLIDDAGGRLALQAEGLALDFPAVPAWTLPLIPAAFDVDVAASGLDLAAATQALIDDFEIGEGLTIPKPALERATALALQKKRHGLTLTRLRLANGLYEVSGSGAVVLKDGVPTGGLEFRATGLDKAIAALQGAAGAPGLAQLLVGLYAAQTLAVPEADGRLLWKIAFDTAGRPLVNGAPLPN